MRFGLKLVRQFTSRARQANVFSETFWVSPESVAMRNTTTTGPPAGASPQSIRQPSVGAVPSSPDWTTVAPFAGVSRATSVVA
jgi:hypothetical protein